MDGNERSSAKLWLGAEECKHLLSRMENAQCSIDSLMDGVDFDINISRSALSHTHHVDISQMMMGMSML